MDKITKEIDEIIEEVQQERTALNNLTSSKMFPDSDYKEDMETVRKYTDTYLQKKSTELTTDNYEFNSAWSLLSYEERRKVINSLKLNNYSDLSSQLEERLVIFEDICDESDSVIQQIMNTVDWYTISCALKMTGDSADYDVNEILERICSCISVRDSSILKEDIEFLGPIPKTKILAARKNICNEVRKICSL